MCSINGKFSKSVLFIFLTYAPMIVYFSFITISLIWLALSSYLMQKFGYSFAHFQRIIVITDTILRSYLVIFIIASIFFFTSFCISRLLPFISTKKFRNIIFLFIVIFLSLILGFQIVFFNEINVKQKLQQASIEIFSKQYGYDKNNFSFTIDFDNYMTQNNCCYLFGFWDVKHNPTINFCDNNSNVNGCFQNLLLPQENRYTFQLIFIIPSIVVLLIQMFCTFMLRRMKRTVTTGDKQNIVIFNSPFMDLIENRSIFTNSESESDMERSIFNNRTDSVFSLDLNEFDERMSSGTFNYKLVSKDSRFGTRYFMDSNIL